jgi:hypothetical protein
MVPICAHPKAVILQYKNGELPHNAGFQEKQEKSANQRLVLKKRTPKKGSSPTPVKIEEPCTPPQSAGLRGVFEMYEFFPM